MLTRYPALLLAAALFLPSPLAATPRDRMLVSPAWLQQHLADPGLVLLQIGERAEFDREHIPGRPVPRASQHLRPSSERARTSSCRRSPSSIRRFAALGVTAGSRVVLYFGSDWVSPTTRAWLTFEYLGLGDRTVDPRRRACRHGRPPGIRSPTECQHRQVTQRRSSRRPSPWS